MKKAKDKKVGRRIRSVALAIALMGLLQAIPGTVRTAYAADDITVTIDTGASVTIKDADGDGYYDIGTADQLYAFAAAVNGGATSINGELTANIVVNESLEGSPRGWTPIGNSSNNFRGQFDGGGHTVKGLVASADYYAGFFGVIYNGEIKNVGVIDSAISGGKPSGGVCGQNSYGTIADCYFTGTVSGWSSQLGGIVGMNYDGTVTGCYNAGTVTSSLYSVGGICGICKSSAKITNCYNTGTISGSTAIGGICGEGVAGTIANCYNTGTVSGNSNVWKICSTAFNTVNCYYLDSSETDSVNGTTYKTEADFKSGAVCWLLNGSTASADSVWGQNVGIDTWPGLNGNIVYSHTLNSKTFYSNGKTAASKTGDVYMIDSADKLRWFVDAVNNAGLMADAKLTADIDLSGRAWNCMNTYAGIFDGDGHTITGLCKNAGMADSKKYGLIRTLSSSGKVINLTISSADLWSDKQGTGAIAEKNEGVISNCIVKNSTLQYGSGKTLAGIAGTNDGTIINCGVVGCNMLRRWSGVGNNTLGYVADVNNGTVSNCYSYGCTSKNASAGYAIVASGNDPVNCYYYTTSTVADTVATAKSADRFASGEVAYLLNGSTIKGDLAWGQTLGTDAYPVFKTEDNTVCGSSNGSTYSNHNEFNENGLCTCCGGYGKAAEVDENGIYQISNAGELLWLAEQVNASLITGFNAILTKDIVIPDNKWVPMDETDASVLDGNGHSITINCSNCESGFGLFARCNNSEVKNLILKGSIVVNTDGTVGALCTSAYKSTFTNVISYVNITNSGTGAVGGLAGKFGGQDGSEINNCAVYADISGTTAGGLVGLGWDGSQYYNIKNSVYAGNVTGTTAGAIVGNHQTGNTTSVFSNVYWNETDGLGFFGTTNKTHDLSTVSAKTAEAFASGEVTYLLNGTATDGTQSWYQTLSGNETDSYPVLNSTHGTVYQIKKYDCPEDTEAEVVYSNTNGDIKGTEHSYVNSVCTGCGKKIELTITLDEGGSFAEGEYTFASNVHTINTNKKVTITGTTTTETVVIAKDVNANITLNGVSIDVSKTDYACAFKIENNSKGNVTITLADGSANILKSGRNYAGLQKNGTEGTLTICGEINGTGSLTATGGVNGAGIGGGYNGEGKNITINGGIVEATGDIGGAGIGGGYDRGGTNITINGGMVTATGKNAGAGIGGGYYKDGTNIIINGGTVKATSVEGEGAGIGGGDRGAGTGITITGGTVTATGSYGGAGIGGGDEGAGTNIIISGGSVKATAGEKANAIGGGRSKNAATPTLADKTTPVYLFEIDNAGSEDIVINDTDYLDKHGTETKIYAYLPAGTDAYPDVIKVGEAVARYYYDAESRRWIETCGSGNHVDEDNDCACDICEYTFAHKDNNGDGSCDVCGTKKDGISATLAGHSVSLGGQIGMNFYMDLDDSVLEDESAYMLFTLPDGSTQSVAVNGGETEDIGGNTYYVFTCNVAAKDMAGTITAKIVCGDGSEGTEYTYSVREYAEALMQNNNATQEQKALAKAMLNYGAYAQKYFDPNVAAGELANVNHPYEEGEFTVTTSGMKNYVPTVTDNSATLDYVGSTLILEADIKVRHYFKLEDGQSYSGNLTQYVAPQENPVDGTYYYYESAGITASALGEMITYTVDDNDDNDISIKYCPLSYVTTVLANENADLGNDTALQNLMKALYLYYKATVAPNNQS